jgi:uncharacterized protein YkwD
VVRAFFAFVFSLLLFSCGERTATVDGPPDGFAVGDKGRRVRIVYYTPDAPESVNREKLLRLVNSARSKGRYCGRRYFPPAPPLKWSATLERAAKEHARDMTLHGFFSHAGSDGSTVGVRLRRLGYRWRTCGENIARGYATEEEVVKGWLASPGHCANLMEAGFEEMGVATDGKNWVQVFGTPLR